MKRCNKCEEEKPLIDFYKNGKKGYYRPWCKICDSIDRKKKHRNDPRKEMVRAAKRRAKAKSLPFDLKYTDISIPDFCPVLNVPISVGTTNSPNSPTLDKIIPKHGYVKGNVMVISRRANTIKTDATPKELMKVAKFYEQLRL